DYFSTEFTVIPSISISADEGTVGSKLTVSGTGFNSNESGIKILYDGNPVETGITANSKGSWQKTLKVPASSRGEHTIDAEGATPATEVEDLVFTILPKIEVSPSSGWVGTAVGIAGSGFGSGETNIKVTYDGATVKTGIAADGKGSWQSSFTVPASTKGSHVVNAYGDITPEGSVVPVNFNVSPGIRLEPVSGHLGGLIHVGDSLWVSGIGFEANEAGIKITFDGTLIASNIVADARGSWVDRLEVPPCPRGEHIIDSSGEITRAEDTAGAVIIVSPKIEISPASGAIGTEITVHGTGFARNQPITISFDEVKVATGIASDARGNFTTSFKIPTSRAGEHTVTVTDAAGSVFAETVSVESTPPPTPDLISPEAGSEFGKIGKTIIAFDWSDVDDPSGVHYVLEISHRADFAGALIRKEGLTASEYVLTENEALENGQYYWRVKAIDNAENESDWTTGQLFKVSAVEWWLLALVVLAGIIVIAIIWRFVAISRQESWR
ncbi:MAG TPA: hypothetical protein EYP71_02645, partial [Dehalococcoidia bacterium]|nr:hypothetical protein [Dehalococcoidia bacterium]